MKKSLAGIVTVVLALAPVALAPVALAPVALAPVAAQDTVKIFTTPKPPGREVLDRLSLTQAWRVKIKTEGLRDGLLSVQVIPGRAPNDTPQVVVQTFHGAVILLDGETGDLIWQTTVGEPYWQGHPVAYNSTSIIVNRREFLYVLNRANGVHRVSRTDKISKQTTYGQQMLTVPSAPPTADEIGIYFVMNNQVLAYALPAYGAAEQVKAADPNGDTRSFLTHPELAWSQVLSGQTFLQIPLATDNRIAVVSVEGTFFSLSKFEQKVLFDFKFNGPATAGMAQHGDVAYVPCTDTIVYALNIANGRLLWRHFSSAALERKADATDRDVFVSAGKTGLTRLDRDTGRDVWTNNTAQRFLSTDFKYLWAVDRLGQLLVLDYQRGTTLAKYDTSEYVVPVSNDLTDRFFFANHDGQVLCLHHRDHRRPVRTKTPPKTREEKRDDMPPMPDPEKKDEKKVEKKVEDKDKEKDKEKAKDKDNGKDKDKDKAARAAPSPAANPAANPAPNPAPNPWFPNSVWEPTTAKLRFAPASARATNRGVVARETEFRGPAFPNGSLGTRETRGGPRAVDPRTVEPRAAGARPPDALVSG